MDKYSVNESVKAQKEYCERKDAPHFAPNNGRCWNCNLNIYESRHWKIDIGRRVPVSKEDAKMTTGITVDEATNHLVTGCPHCNRSYCD